MKYLQTHRSTYLVTLLLALMVLSISALSLVQFRPAFAQTATGPFLRLLSVDDSQYPQLTLLLEARSETGAPAGNLGPNNLAIEAGDVAIDDFTVQTDSTLGLDVVLVLDRSTDAANWTTTQALAADALALLRPQDRVAITVFADAVEEVQPLTDDVDAALAALADTAPAGQFSASYPAMIDAIERLAAQNSTRGVVIVIADAPDNISQQAPDDVLAAAQATGYAIAIASYGPGENVAEYDAISLDSGGRRAAAATVGDLPQPVAQWVSSYLATWSVQFAAPIAGDNQDYPLAVTYSTAAGEDSAQTQFTAQLREVTVALLGLEANQPVAGVFDLAVDATTPADLAQVEYRVDGQAIGTTSTLAPFAWDTTTVDPGARLLEVTVTDSAGNTGTAAVEVQVVRPAPRLQVLAVDSSNFPQVAIGVDAFGANGLPLVGLEAGSFAIQENDSAVAGELVATPATDQPLGLVLVLDRSVSVADWAQIRTAANTLIDNLRPDDEIGIYAFGTDVTLVQAVTANQGAAKAALATVEAQPPAPGPAGSDSTSATNALYSALLDGVNQAALISHPRAAVIAVSDGLDSTGALSVGQLSDVLVGQSVPVHLLAFGSGIESPGLVAGLAQLTGGNASTVNTAADVRTAMQTLGSLLQSGYRLAYSSTQAADGGNYEVAVTLTAQGAQATDVGTFVAQPGEVTVTIPGVQAGATIAGSVDLTAQAQTPAPITSVVYRINGDILAEVDDLEFTIMWNSDTVTPGAYTLDVTVTDAVGNVGTAAVDFTVVAPLVLSVDYATPALAQGVEIGERVDLDVAVDVAEGANNTVQVEAGVDGRVVATDDRPPYQLSFGTADLTPGARVITVVARNSDGYQAVQELDLTLTAPATAATDDTATAGTDATDAGTTGFWAGLFGGDTTPETETETAPTSSGISLGQILRWLAILVVLAALIGLGAWLFGMIRRSRRERKLTPVRMTLSNTGNAATAYLLRGEDEERTLAFQFWLDGRQLGLPPVARLETAPAASAATGQSRYAPTPVQSAPGTPINGAAGDEYGDEYGEPGEGGAGIGGSLKGAGGKMQEAGMVAGILASILTSVAMFLPRGLQRPIRQVAMTLRRGTMLSRRVGHVQRQVGRLNQSEMGSQVVERTQQGASQLGEAATSDAARQAVYGAGRTAQGAMVAGAGAGTATAQRSASRLSDWGGTLTQARNAAAGAAAGVVNSATGVLTGGNNRQWVYVPQLQPGDTVTIDILVGEAGKNLTTRHYPFRLVSRALDDDAATQVVEEASVRIQGAAWWQRYLWPILGAAAVLIALLAALIWLF
ncbi:MAG: VWA domain-containing protein [Litorilinea sp.]